MPALVQEELGGERLAPGQGSIEGRNNHLFNLGAAEALGRPCQARSVERAGVVPATLEVDPEDCFFRRQVRQIDKKDLVEPTFPQEFGR